MPVKYSDVLKRDSVTLVLEQGMSQRQVCRDMGVSRSALQGWVRDEELKRREMAPDTRGDLEARGGQAQLLKRITELERENEVLWRVTSYLSKAKIRVDSISGE